MTNAGEKGADRRPRPTLSRLEVLFSRATQSAYRRTILVTRSLQFELLLRTGTDSVHIFAVIEHHA
jgi:hypothetical protein